MGKIIFVTGTDTGAGKTVLTAQLTRFARRQGHHVLAIKPFASGSRTDAAALAEAMDHELSCEMITPFFYREALAPGAAVARGALRVNIGEVIRVIQDRAATCEVLLVEGIGGLYVPLSDHYTVRDIIQRLRPSVLVAAANKLGAVNHTLLTVNALRQLRLPNLQIVLMQSTRRNLATETNFEIISRWAAPQQTFLLPYLGKNPFKNAVFSKTQKNFQKTLAEILAMAMFSPASTNEASENKKNACAKVEEK